MIAIIFCGDLKYCPYIKRYIERLEISGQEYDVYFWNRSGERCDLPDNYFYYEVASKLKKNKLLKLIDFINFRGWLKSKIKREKYNRLIILSTLSGLILYDVLQEYSGNYIFDIRDYSYEKNKIYYWFESKLINSSAYTTISSKGFKNFLPEYNYVIAHNFNRQDMKYNKHFIKKECSQPINIVWNGVLRYFEIQKQYIDVFKNDNRFKLIYHGDGPDFDMYIEYCKNEGIENVLFTGRYNNYDKEKLLLCADIINNSYCTSVHQSYETLYAVSNRYYDGIVFHIPQLVEQTGYKACLVKENLLGITPTINSELPDLVYDYYTSINADDFNKKCDLELESILEEDDIYIECIDKFIRGNR